VGDLVIRHATQNRRLIIVGKDLIHQIIARNARPGISLYQTPHKTG